MPIIFLFFITAYFAIPIFMEQSKGFTSNLIKIFEVISGERDDYNNRLGMLLGGITLFMKNPITGYGINSENYLMGKNFHNTFLTFSVELGIIGIIILFFLIKFYFEEIRFKTNVIKLNSSKNDIHDLSILIGFFPVFVMFLFLGQTTIIYFMIAFFASFTYARSKQRYEKQLCV